MHILVVEHVAYPLKQNKTNISETPTTELQYIKKIRVMMTLTNHENIGLTT